MNVIEDTDQPKLTEGYIQHVVEEWMDRLSMNHIEVEIKWDEEPENEDALASVTPSSLYDFAEMRFADSVFEFDKKKLNRIVVHELMHILERDLSQAINSVTHMGFMPSTVVHLWMENVEAASEGFVDRLAVRFVDLAGVVE